MTDNFNELVSKGGLRYANPLNNWELHVKDDGATMANMTLTDENIEKMFEASLAVAGEELYNRFHKSLELQDEDEGLRNLVMEYLTEATDDMERFTDRILDKAAKVYAKGSHEVDIIDMAETGIAVDFAEHLFDKATRNSGATYVVNEATMNKIQNRLGAPRSGWEKIGDAAADVVSDAIRGRGGKLANWLVTQGTNTIMGSDKQKAKARESLVGGATSAAQTVGGMAGGILGQGVEQGGDIGSKTSGAVKETLGGLLNPAKPTTAQTTTTQGTTTAGESQPEIKEEIPKPGAGGTAGGGGGSTETISGTGAGKDKAAGGVGTAQTPPKQKTAIAGQKSTTTTKTTTPPKPSVPKKSSMLFEDLFMKSFNTGSFDTFAKGTHYTEESKSDEIKRG